MIRSILFATILGSCGAQDQSDKGAGSGRYQLVAAEIETVAQARTEKTLFKIDTVTGATWRYSKVVIQIPEEKRLYPQVTGAGAEGWIPIGEFSKAFDEAVNENEKK